MKELSPREEQAMIDLAKAGDPEANYNMSLWALAHAEEEPEEDRWNRLAAKCLVKAAQAGYAPAVAKMTGLLHPPAEERRAPEPRKAPPAPRPEPIQKRPRAQAPAEPETPSATGGIRSLPGKVVALFPKREKAPVEPRPAREPRERVPFLQRFDEWDDTKWKRLQFICIAVCVVLAALIAFMLIKGKNKPDAVPEQPQLPVAPTAEPAAPSPTPEAETLFPDEAVRFAIQRADLEVFPGDDDYVTEATSATVRTSGSELRMRKGPDADYDQIDTIVNGSTVEVYAFKEKWVLVQHNSSWGWCSGDYLIIGQ